MELALFISLPIITYLVVACIETVYVWYGYWRKKKEYTVYDMFFEVVYDFREGSSILVEIFTMLRWIPAANLIPIILIPFVILYELILHRLIEWMKNKTITQDEPVTTSQNDRLDVTLKNYDNKNDKTVIVK